MFYGVPPGRGKELQQALATIADIYKGQFYCNDMLICLWRNMSFRKDQKFISCFYDSVTDEQEQSLIWRLHTLVWAAKNALTVEGDFVECGVFKGFCSEVILKYLDFQDIPRRAFLYDTFEGLVTLDNIVRSSHPRIPCSFFAKQISFHFSIRVCS